MLTTGIYKNFIYGRYFSEGLRMTAGIALPALLFGYFNLLDIGLVLSTGALCISVTDSAGPVHHRANGMFFCTVVIAFTSVVTYFSLYDEITAGLIIVIFGFIYSMMSVYNARVSSVGISGLLIMILSMQIPLKGSDIFIHALYLMAGGIWYMIFSLSLHTLKPYKIIQQLSGEFISGVSDYLKTRAAFYDDQPDYDKIYHSLFQQQVNIEAQQAALNELLFKTRAITKNSTNAGRSLLKIYLDVSDLFESIMSAYQQYEILHKKFDETGILDEYRKHLVFMADELQVIANAVSAGIPSVPNSFIKENLVAVKEKFEGLRMNFMNENNLVDFISLGRIYNNIKGLSEKITGLHYYTRYVKVSVTQQEKEPYLQRFNEEQTIAPALFLNNLNFNSNIFRHSLRVAISLFAGYLISLFFNLGHSFWILLTIVVILKPAYSLTKKRNSDRIAGTLAGIIVGVIILFTVKKALMLLIIMLIFMAASYMFIRTKYFISVFLMTTYLVIFFHLIYPGSITSILTDRITDTAIGSAIAFLASLFFVPAWEHTTIRKYMDVLLQKNIEYFKALSVNFTGLSASPDTQLKRKRQDSLTALANVSDAFNRMLSEPKRFQKNTEYIYRFAVLNHILTSHFSALAFFLKGQKIIYTSPEIIPVTESTVNKLDAAVQLLHGNTIPEFSDTDTLNNLQEETNILLRTRKIEIAEGLMESDTRRKLIQAGSVIDQFTYIYNLSGDILKNVTAFTAEDAPLMQVNPDQ